MNSCRSFLLLLFLLLNSGAAYSQSAIQTSVDSGRTKSLSGFARDFWFSMATNYVSGGGKYYELYVVSEKEATINVSIGKATSQSFSTQPYEVLVYRVPLAWEMLQSGVVEDKAIHVWSKDADLSVVLLSRNPATSGSMSVVPSNGWGTDYVIATFASYAYLPGNEFPSEFVLVAKEDNTVVNIIPTADLRHGFSTAVAYQRGKPFTVTLMKGQSVQYMCSAANGDMENFDLSGTRITSNRPIGVVAGVQCANIPAENPYCDHITEMLLPVDRWGKRYFSAPFAKRVGGDGFRVIAAEDGTTIYRRDNTGKVVHCVLNKYEYYMVHDIANSSEWTSDKPFMLVQYMNGTDYPQMGANNGVGDPAMVVLSPVEAYEKSTVIMTPSIQSAEVQFNNRVNLIVPKAAAASLRFDGKLVAPLTNDSLSVPGTDYSIYLFSNVRPGAHSVTADSGVGSYVYGYGTYDAYAHPGGAYGGGFGAITDSLSPQLVAIENGCYTVSVTVEDQGADRSGWISQSTDTLHNAKLLLIDVHGDQNEIAEYRIGVVDPSLPMYARVRLSDASGNLKVFTHTYAPSFPVVTDDEQVMIAADQQETRLALPIKASAANPLDSIKYLFTQGESFLVEGPSRLEAGQEDSIVIRYRQTGLEHTFDTLVISAKCWSHRIPLHGSPVPFASLEIVEDTLDFKIVVLGEDREQSFQIKNTGTETVTIESLSIDQNSDFTLGPIVTPTGVAYNSSLPIPVRFEPTSEGPKEATVTVVTSIGEFKVIVMGEGRDLSDVAYDVEKTTINVYPRPAHSILHIETRGDATVINVRVLDLTGKELLHVHHQATSVQIPVDELPAGAYIISVQTSERTEFVKVTIEH